MRRVVGIDYPSFSFVQKSGNELGAWCFAEPHEHEHCDDDGE